MQIRWKAMWPCDDHRAWLRSLGLDSTSGGSEKGSRERWYQRDPFPRPFLCFKFWSG